MKFPKEYEPFFAYVDELVRECARSDIQHEADQQRILALCDRVEQLERDGGPLVAEARERAHIAENKLGGVNAMLARAIEDLHFVMAGGDPCKVCAKVCMMGEGNCQPVWTGEKTED